MASYVIVLLEATFLVFLQKFQHQLQAKHPTFFATTRLGRNLKDRCTKTDPEREVLNNMLEELRNKWNAVRSVVTKR
jgi:dystonin